MEGTAINYFAPFAREKKRLAESGTNILKQTGVNPGEQAAAVIQRSPAL
jgi:hypothetical protein